VRAYLVLETGEVLHPVRAELGPGKGIGDGLALAAPDSEAARQWAPLLQPMPERLRPTLERLRAASA
jgi:hypothetical protein